MDQQKKQECWAIAQVLISTLKLLNLTFLWNNKVILQPRGIRYDHVSEFPVATLPFIVQGTKNQY